MNAAIAITATMTAEQNEQITRTVREERRRLFSFIKDRVPESEDAEDVLQDVFYELTEMYRLMKPVEKISAWLFTTARNKITDLFRKKKAVPFSKVESGTGASDEETETEEFYSLIPDLADGPEALLMREVVRDEMNKALKKMPRKHRDVFLQTEIEGKSFKEISSSTGVPVNTLISRKRYAVLFLRERLQEIYDELLNN
jgi:RNA polymerase sigma factor (sigma-70 family)